MKGKILFVTILIVQIGLSDISLCHGFDNNITHPDITKNAISSSQLNTILKDRLGLSDGKDTLLSYIDSSSNYTTSATIGEILRSGSRAEDIPACRADSHFHDPTRNMGLSDVIYSATDPVGILMPGPSIFIPGTPFVVNMGKGFIAYCAAEGALTGRFYIPWYSDVTWATGYTSAGTPAKITGTKKATGNEWDWDHTRNAYFLGMVSPAKQDRDNYLAATFYGLGHELHLLQDMAVPAHVRNDFLGHVVPERFEAYVRDRADARNLIKEYPAIDITNAPYTNYWDSDLYDGTNPAITAFQGGLAEYTNANFLSKNSMLTDSLPGPYYFPYPKASSTVLWKDTTNDTKYLRKNGDGETVDHLAVSSLLDWYRWKYFPQDKYFRPIGLDEKCFYDYASKLLPRAVGYSAGLLNYFFRGEFKLSYETTDTPGYVIVNNTGEKMEGDFVIFYDKAGDERVPLWAGRGTLEATIGDKTNTFDFIPPGDAKEPGKYIVVFKGKMGNEEGAVAGYVLQRLLKITPPDQFLYSIADEDQSDPYFTSIKAKVKNASTSEAIQNGVIQAVAKYKTDIDDVDYIYSMSAPQSISSLPSDQATEFEFNFSNDPIPVDVTDLYLQVIFKGTIGNENNAVAIGLKDISEPTPIDVFNNMDRICINGSWYVAGSAEAYDALPSNAKWWDYWPHDLENEYIKISPVKDPCVDCDASPSN